MFSMNKNIEGILAIAAALLVLFSAMLDPKVSMIIAVVALAGRYLISTLETLVDKLGWSFEPQTKM